MISVEVEDGIVFNSSFKVETIKKESIHPPRQQDYSSVEHGKDYRQYTARCGIW